MVVLIKGIDKRESNFELLRIISMLFIILHHLIFNGRYQFNNFFCINDFILTFFRSGGKLGTILFVMITGYYMINKKEIRIKKLIEMEFQVLFYSIILFFILFSFNDSKVTLNLLFNIFLPNISKSYWFFSGYFILYLCIPYLNRLLLSLNKKNFEKLLLIGFVFLILLPSVVIYNKSITETIYLFYYYMIGGYISLFPIKSNGNLKNFLLFGVSYFFIVIFTMYIRKMSLSNSILSQYIYTYSNISSIFVFISGISLFLFFKELRIGKIKFINLLSSFSFGVYLFHEHTFMRDLLWVYIFGKDKILNGSFFINCLLVAIIVYIVGGFFEIVRNIIFDFFKKLKKYWKRNILHEDYILKE